MEYNTRNDVRKSFAEYRGIKTSATKIEESRRDREADHCFNA